MEKKDKKKTRLIEHFQSTYVVIHLILDAIALFLAYKCSRSSIKEKFHPIMIWVAACMCPHLFIFFVAIESKFKFCLK